MPVLASSPGLSRLGRLHLFPPSRLPVPSAARHRARRRQDAKNGDTNRGLDAGTKVPTQEGQEPASLPCWRRVAIVLRWKRLVFRPTSLVGSQRLPLRRRRCRRGSLAVSGAARIDRRSACLCRQCLFFLFSCPACRAHLSRYNGWLKGFPCPACLLWNEPIRTPHMQAGRAFSCWAGPDGCAGCVCQP